MVCEAELTDRRRERRRCEKGLKNILIKTNMMRPIEFNEFLLHVSFANKYEIHDIKLRTLT